MNYPKLKSHLKFVYFKDKISIGNTPRTAIEIVDPNKLIYNILLLCDGNHAISQIFEIVNTNYPNTTLLDVADIINQVADNGYILEDAILENNINLSKRVLERHSRNINFLSNFDKKGDKKFEYIQKILNCNVLLIGLGGVGSSLTYNLCALGVNNLIAVDFDIVDRSNLNRQILYKESDIGKLKIDAAEKTVKNFNSDVKFIKKNIELKSEEEIENLIIKYNINFVFCAADKPPLKIYSWVNNACLNHGIPWIYGGNSETTSYFQTIMPGKSSCYNCKIENFKINNNEEAIAKYNEILKFGNRTQNNCIAASSSALSSFMIFEFIKIITKCENPLSLNKLSIFNYLDYTFTFEDIPKSNKCKCNLLKGGDSHEN